VRDGCVGHNRPAGVERFHFLMSSMMHLDGYVLRANVRLLRNPKNNPAQLIFR
jgi:hypothetical protein